MVGIPEVVNDFNMYGNGSKLVGINAEVPIPELEAITETISGAGILGEYDAPAIGHFSSIEQEIPFNVVDEDYFRLINPTDPVDITLRAAIQVTNTQSGAIDYMGLRIVERGRAKKISIGTAKQGGKTDSTIAVELFYIMVELNGKKQLELGKFTGVYNIGGQDMLSKVRSLT